MAGSPPGPSPTEVCEGQAHCEFASGQLVRLQRPVTLYWLRQKVCVCVLALKEQKRWLITPQMTSSCCIDTPRPAPIQAPTPITTPVNEKDCASVWTERVDVSQHSVGDSPHSSFTPQKSLKK